MTSLGSQESTCSGAPPLCEGLSLRDIVITLEVPLFDPISLDIPPGDIMTLMGSSGVGKSSLLAFLTGTLSRSFKTHGQVYIHQKEITQTPPEKRHLGILFQDDLLFPHLSVGQNLALAIPKSVKGEKRQEKIYAALEEAGLTGYENRDPATLSGGQKARIALLRVLLSEPKALLLDEPFSKIDPETRSTFRYFVYDHVRTLKLPTLLVTHDPQDASIAQGRLKELKKT